jgi:hypothetical protein
MIDIDAMAQIIIALGRELSQGKQDMQGTTTEAANP